MTQNRIPAAVWGVALPLCALFYVLVEVGEPGSLVLRVAEAHFCK